MSFLRHLEDRAALALRIWIIAGVLLRITHLRDRFDGLSLVFYSTPWPVMAFGFAGLAVHWPFNLPVLSLDQVWLGSRLRPVSCANRWTWLSDHEPVAVTFAPEGF